MYHCYFFRNFKIFELNIHFVSTGFVGGSYYNVQGGGANHMCLHSEPIFRPNDEKRSTRATVYGTEYHNPPNQPQLDRHDVPCAVCLVTRSVVLMIPGTNLCNEGWTTEYVGQIASEHSGGTNHRSEFICLDEDAEMTAYSSPNQDNGAILHTTQVICGSLPCIPYVEDKDLLCVVCSL